LTENCQLVILENNLIIRILKKNKAMKTQQIDKKILKNPIIKEYYESSNPTLREHIAKKWIVLGNKLKVEFGEDEINYTSLAALADALHTKRSDDKVLYQHALKLKKDYVGASEFRKLLELFRNEEVLPIKITIDYKTLYKKGDKNSPRIDDDVKTNSSEKTVMSGFHIVNALMNLISDRKIENYSNVMEMFELYPPIDVSKYPAKKKDLMTLHARNGSKILADFFSEYNLEPKQVKLLTMKTLAFIGFIVPYAIYLKKHVPTGRAKARAENEYYLQRYTDLNKG
jgi:hypothetical protein